MSGSLISTYLLANANLKIPPTRVGGFVHLSLKIKKSTKSVGGIHRVCAGGIRLKTIIHPLTWVVFVQSSTYQQNLRNAPIRDKTQTISPGVYVATESRLGLPAGTRFFSRLTSDSLFELSLAKTDKGMKIVWAQVYPFN